MWERSDPIKKSSRFTSHLFIVSIMYSECPQSGLGHGVTVKFAGCWVFGGSLEFSGFDFHRDSGSLRQICLLFQAQEWALPSSSFP